MKRRTRTYLQIGAGIVVIGLLAWAVSRGLERLAGLQPESGTAVTGTAAPAASVPRITATLYYGSADGQSLVPVRREVPLAEGLVPRGRAAPGGAVTIRLGHPRGHDASRVLRDGSRRRLRRSQPRGVLSASWRFFH